MHVQEKQRDELFGLKVPNLLFRPLGSMEGDTGPRLLNKRGELEVSHWTLGEVTALTSVFSQVIRNPSELGVSIWGVDSSQERS